MRALTPPQRLGSLPLDRLPVLLLDVQTTGASPARGHLLEVAWARTTAAAEEAPAITSHRVALPEGVGVPARIQALTGISAEDLVGASSPAVVWQELAAAADALEGGYALAHLARFERSFLEDLHARVETGKAFPLRFLCTHEIAVRLFPELPRRGLRALAGRLGHPVEEGRRAEQHVRATARVWAGIVERLRESAGVVDAVGLARYLAEVEPKRRAGRSFAIPRGVRLDLPERPGVYRMLGRQGNVLYVGKATSLKRRVNGYFQKRRHTRVPMLEMLTQVFDLDVTCTATALEAALLETDEIKRHDPPYNVQLRTRDPEFVFIGRRSLDMAATPSATHPIGPIPRPSIEALAGVEHLFGRSPGALESWHAALGLAHDAKPDPAVLEAGREQFIQTHGLPQGASSASCAWSPGRLLGLGHRLWHERLRQAALPEAEDADDAERPAERSRGPWTPADPEAVCRALERSLLGSAHAVRRARLLTRFSECSFGWLPPKGGVGGRARLIVLEDGHLIHAEDTTLDAVPPPPGWPRSRLRRARAFDVATFDRVRVLLGEMRRLVTADASIVCRLGPREVLSRQALAARLAWL